MAFLGILFIQLIRSWRALSPTTYTFVLVLVFLVDSVGTLSRAIQSFHQNLTLAMDHSNLDHIAQPHPENYATQSILFSNYIFLFCNYCCCFFFFSGGGWGDKCSLLKQHNSPVKLAYKDWLTSICTVMIIAWVRATTSHLTTKKKGHCDY